MAEKMKLCKKCEKWTNEQVSKCPICGFNLIQASLTDIFWNKISDEEKEKYTKEYMNSEDYMKEEEKEELPEGMVFHMRGYNGQLYVYEDRVVIERTGAVGTITHGLAGSKTIPMSTIQNIQLKKAGPFFNGFIQFGILGGMERQGGIGGAVSDENAIVFLESCNNKALKIKEYIENIIINRGKNDKVEVPNSLFVADEIMKLKSLLDMGILTQEEFDEKKKQLLNL